MLKEGRCLGERERRETHGKEGRKEIERNQREEKEPEGKRKADPEERGRGQEKEERDEALRVGVKASLEDRRK